MTITSGISSDGWPWPRAVHDDSVTCPRSGHLGRACRTIMALGVAAALFGIAGASAAEPASEPAKPVAPPELVDFDTQIEPIFRRQCLKCHGDERSGGLRLDSRQSAAAGGDSGKPILGGTLDTNELYQRVSSDDRTYRMPKNSDPLDEGEIETIKRWVGQGTPWPRQRAANDDQLLAQCHGQVHPAARSRNPLAARVRSVFPGGAVGAVRH